MWLLQPFLDSLKPGGYVLDLGAGTGLQAKDAAKRGLRITAVDILDKPESVTEPEIQWIKTSLETYLEQLSSDQLFNGILMQNIIHFFPKSYVLGTMLTVLKAHLKQDGLLAIETMTAPPEPPLKKFQSFYTPQELANTLECRVLLSEQNDSQRVEDDGSVRTFHHTRVLVQRDYR